MARGNPFFAIAALTSADMIRNEHIKLTANALDRASTACFTVGIATPAAGLLYNIGGFRTTVSLLSLAAGLGGWLLVAFGLHYLAHRMLRKLQE
jgi:hypothetical protein